jgi:hypothetical protein
MIRFTKGTSKKADYTSTAFIMWNDDEPLEYIIKNEYDNALSENKKYHVIDVKIVTNIEKTTFYNVWAETQVEISEKEYTDLKRFLVEI